MESNPWPLDYEASALPLSYNCWRPVPLKLQCDYHLSRLGIQHLVVDLEGRLDVLHLHGHVVHLVGDLGHLVAEVVAETLHVLARGVLSSVVLLLAIIVLIIRDRPSFPKLLKPSRASLIKLFWKPATSLVLGATWVWFLKHFLTWAVHLLFTKLRTQLSHLCEEITKNTSLTWINEGIFNGNFTGEAFFLTSLLKNQAVKIFFRNVD